MAERYARIAVELDQNSGQAREVLARVLKQDT